MEEQPIKKGLDSSFIPPPTTDQEPSPNTILKRVLPALRFVALPLFFLLLGWLIQTLAVLSHTRIDYSGSQWATPNLWLSPIETNNEWSRFTLKSNITDAVWVDDRWIGISGTEIFASKDGENWNRRQRLSSEVLGIAYDPASKRLVAVGNFQLFTSTDLGNEWKVVDGIENPLLSTVKFNGRQWVAVGSDKIFVSENGQRWQALEETPQSTPIIDLASSGNRWVATAASTFLVSDDGLNWTRVALPGDAQHVEKIATDGDRWVATGHDAIYISDDGLNWESPSDITILFPIFDFENEITRVPPEVHFQNGQWIVTGDNSFTTTSNDGRTWSPFSASPNNYEKAFQKIVSHPEQWLALGNTLLQSKDAQDWQKIEQSPLNGIWDLSANSSRWIAAAGNNLLHSVDGQTWHFVNELAASDDFIDTTQQQSSKAAQVNNSQLLETPDNPEFYATASSESLSIAVGYQGSATSTDGLNWSYSSSTANLTEIATNGRLWVGVGFGGISTSANGLDWQRANLKSRIGYLNSIATNGDHWIAGSDDIHFFSADGIDWLEIDITLDNPILEISGNQNRWTAVGYDGIYSSTDGISWQLLEDTPETLDLQSVATDGQRWVAVGGNSILFSEDGLKWQAAQVPYVDNNLTDVTSNGKGWVAAGSSVLLFSDDGLSWVDLAADKHYLPPLAYLSFVLAFVSTVVFVFLLSRQKRTISEPNRTSKETATSLVASNEFKSDSAISRIEDDKLGRAQMALALSEFIRNRSNSKPFTLAISGDWGSGKSSFMGMMSDDLKKTGYSPVWFNAWHHQDSHLLTGLLVAMQEQSVPKFFTLRGLVFRLFLIASRSIVSLIAIIFLVAGLFSYSYSQYRSPSVRTEVFTASLSLPMFFSDSVIESLERQLPETCHWPAYRGEYVNKRLLLLNNDTLNSVKANSNPSPLSAQCQFQLIQYLNQELGTGLSYMYRIARLKVAPSLVFLGTLLGAIAALFSGLGVFGFNLRLKSNLSAAANNNPVAVHAVYKRLQQFSRALKWSRGPSLVIFIDDLDRMDKEKLHELLERLSMLSSDNREAFFVLGMDYERVVAHLDARLLETFNSKNNTAKLYLHKMINVVFTPTQVEAYAKLANAGQSATPEENDPQRKRQRLLKIADKALGFLAIAGLVFASYSVHIALTPDHSIMHSSDKARAIAYTSNENTSVGSGAQTNAAIDFFQNITPYQDSVNSGNATNTLGGTAKGPRVFRPRSDAKTTTERLIAWWPVPTILLLIVLFTWLLNKLDNSQQPDDSKPFSDALKHFDLSLAGLRRTPRQSRRSGNLLRMINLYKSTMGDPLPEENLQQLIVVYIFHLLGIKETDLQLALIEKVIGFKEEQTEEVLNWLIANSSTTNKDYYQEHIGSFWARFEHDISNSEVNIKGITASQLTLLNALLLAFN